jgi:hypothetical protein
MACAHVHACIACPGSRMVVRRGAPVPGARWCTLWAGSPLSCAISRPGAITDRPPSGHTTQQCRATFDTPAVHSHGFFLGGGSYLVLLPVHICPTGVSGTPRTRKPHRTHDATDTRRRLMHACSQHPLACRMPSHDPMHGVTQHVCPLLPPCVPSSTGCSLLALHAGGRHASQLQHHQEAPDERGQNWLMTAVWAAVAASR